MEDIRKELEALRQVDALRRLPEVEPLGGMRARVDGVPCTLFCTNDYLGLSANPRVLARARKALEMEGAGARASRLVAGDLPVHRALEAVTARFKGEETALIFPTGFAANLGCVPALVGQGDAVFGDRLNHASLVDACRASGARFRVYAHADPEALRRALARAGSARRRLVVTDSLFSMDGDTAPLSALMEVALEFGAEVLVDDAHGTGVLGEGGRGIAHIAPLPRRPLITGTYSKALGSQGGFAAGPREFRDLLFNRARSFMYTTAPAPAVAGAALGAVEVLEEEPKRVESLRAKCRRVREGLAALGFRLPPGEGPILPVVFGGNAEALAASRRLLEAGVFAPAIRPPTVPKGSARVRVTVSDAHTQEDLDLLLEAFRKL